MRTLAIRILVALVAVLGVLGLAAAPARAEPTRITWHGHAAFSIVTRTGKVLLIDPWLRNPLNPNKDPLSELKRVDFILVTHGHFDHVGEAVAIAKKTGARLVAPFELATNLVRLHGFPAKQMGFDTLGNVGGVLALDGEITVAFVPALHSSGLDAPDGEAKGLPIAYGGQPVGYVVQLKGGPTVYHSGDTAYFRDLESVAELAPDLALLNIGGHFGMEPPAAARAAQAVKAKWVVPHHYRTFPILTQDAQPFYRLLDKEKIGHVDLQPGQTLTFEGHELKR